MTRDDVHPKPLLDPTVLDRLRLTLTTGDLAGALDSVLSLKTSSQMVGAERLAELALDLERSLRSADAELETVLPKLAVAHLRPIMKCEQQTADLLSRYLHDRPASE